MCGKNKLNFVPTLLAVSCLLVVLLQFYGVSRSGDDSSVLLLLIHLRLPQVPSIVVCHSCCYCCCCCIPSSGPRLLLLLLLLPIREAGAIWYSLWLVVVECLVRGPVPWPWCSLVGGAPQLPITILFLVVTYTRNCRRLQFCGDISWYILLKYTLKCINVHTLYFASCHPCCNYARLVVWRLPCGVPRDRSTGSLY